jgi:hypothetical protein
MRKIAIALLMLGAIGLVAFPCLAAEEKAAPAKAAPMPGKGMGAKMAAAKAPVVKLERIDVANFQTFYLDATAKRGSTLNLGFVFAMENPNNFKMMLDEIKFSVNFEDFYVASIAYYDDNYIPAKTTDYVRVNGYFEAMTGMATLRTVGGVQLKEMDKKPDDLLKKWWDEIGDFSFPIKVMGSATFVGPDGKNMIVQFEGTFPPKP